MFCDGDGNPVLDGPKSYRTTTFLSIDGAKTKIDMVITFEEKFTLNVFVEEGFEVGIAMTLTC